MKNTLSLIRFTHSYCHAGCETCTCYFHILLWICGESVLTETNTVYFKYQQFLSFVFMLYMEQKAFSNRYIKPIITDFIMFFLHLNPECCQSFFLVTTEYLSLSAEWKDRLIVLHIKQLCNPVISNATSCHQEVKIWNRFQIKLLLIVSNNFLYFPCFLIARNSERIRNPSKFTFAVIHP